MWLPPCGQAHARGSGPVVAAGTGPPFSYLGTQFQATCPRQDGVAQPGVHSNNPRPLAGTDTTWMGGGLR